MVRMLVTVKVTAMAKHVCMYEYIRVVHMYIYIFIHVYVHTV